MFIPTPFGFSRLRLLLLLLLLLLVLSLLCLLVWSYCFKFIPCYITWYKQFIPASASDGRLPQTAAERRRSLWSSASACGGNYSILYYTILYYTILYYTISSRTTVGSPHVYRPGRHGLELSTCAPNMVDTRAMYYVNITICIYIYIYIHI